MQPPSVTSESFLAGIPHRRSPGTCRVVPVCCSQSNSKGVREPEPGTASGLRALRAAPHASILSATFPQPPGAALACARAGFVAPASRWRASAVGDSPDRPVLRHEATGPQSESALPTPVQALLRSSLHPVPFTSRSRGAALPLAMPVTVTELPQAFRAVTTIDHDAQLFVAAGFTDIAFGHQDA